MGIPTTNRQKAAVRISSIVEAIVLKIEWNVLMKGDIIKPNKAFINITENNKKKLKNG